MKCRIFRAVIALLLVMCMSTGLVPAVAAPAQAEESAALLAAGGRLDRIFSFPEDGEGATLEEKFDSIMKKIGDDPTLQDVGIQFTQNVTVESPLRVANYKANPEQHKVRVVICGSGGIKVKASSSPTVPWAEKSGVFRVYSNVTAVFTDITIDGNRATRCIYVDAKASLALEAVSIADGFHTQRGPTIQNGVAPGGGNGGGVYCAGRYGTDVDGDKDFFLAQDVTFVNNTTAMNVPTGGGALYIGPEINAGIWLCSFSGNESHSGGALYAYKSTVVVEECKFEINRAGQRGGAIHCHSLLAISNSTFTENESGQYGGAIYISADSTTQGAVVMENTSVTGNKASGGGGGVYIASDGTLYLANHSTVYGNSYPDAPPGAPEWMPDEWKKNNVFYAAGSSKIVVCDDTVGKVGVSTSNAYNRKLAVYSIGQAEVIFPSDDFSNIENGNGTVYEPTIDPAYIMSADTPHNFVSDSEVWVLNGINEDPEGINENRLCCNGNLWFMINPNYGVHAGQENVIFNYNLPGVGATIYPNSATISEIKKGDTIPLPELWETSAGGAVFKPLGWFTEAMGGTKVEDSVTVSGGTQVYYAQWDVGEQPALTGDLFTVYWDYNYEGGGVVSSLVGTFALKVEVAISVPGGEEGGGGTATTTQTKEVTIPFSVPGKPYRPGYTFQGWAKTPTAQSGTLSPAAPSASTTFYGVWKAQTYTLTWNANGGSGGTTTNQAHDSIVTPPTAVPTRTGYRFTGWYLDKNCTVPLVSGTVVEGPATYYAGWTEKEYLITWDTAYTGGPIFVTGQNHGERLDIVTDPTREGYTFDGWFTSATGGNKVSTSTEVGGDVTYYAHWKAKSYTLTWNANGGDGGTTTAQNYDDLIVLPAAPTRTGYRFTGWYQDAACTVPLTSGSRVTGNATYYAGWTAKDYIITWDTAYTGGPVMVTGQDHDEAVIVPTQPSRPGYVFNGWFTADGTAVADYGTVREDVTFYAHWTAVEYTLTWNANGGSSSTTTVQSHDELIVLPDAPTREGYIFVGWFLDGACTMPLVSGARVSRDETFYAGWTPIECEITWDAGYTGGGATTVTQYYDEALNILPAPTREGYAFGGWYTYTDSGDVRAEAYGTVREDVTFTARWLTLAQSYTVTVEWADYSNNDNVRPAFITVALLANGIPMGRSYRLTAADADETGDIWTYTFDGLPITDAVSNPITYSVAITSSVSDEYTYGIENKSAELGYILMTHSLITRDVDAYVVWDDEGDNDGYRPATVRLQLCANGEAVEDGEAVVALSGSGDTWFYQFRDVQKYYTDADGNRGQEIAYALEASPTNPGELDEYEIEYRDYTVILRHRKDVVSRTVHVEWNDSNDQDGKRPASVTVQLYADNVPVRGKYVTLSEANAWSYTWDDLPRYADGGREVVYSARVTSTLVDYAAQSTEMTIELTYVPSSTAISAFVTWMDDRDADGLRPEYVTAELVADGVPTGDTQILTATNGWTTTWQGYPIYEDGQRVEYTFRIDPMAEGYEAEYHGVYDTSGLSAVLTHTRLTQSLTGRVLWDDQDNQSGGRMSRVAVYLCADGSVIDENDKVWITSDGGWTHTFEDLPIYRDGGTEIKYSIVLASDPGKYEVTTNGMTVTLRLDPEYVDVSLQILWDDNNDSDGVRPDYVGVTLLVDGSPSQYGQTATPQSGWAVTFEGLDKYGPEGVYRYTPQLAAVPDGYAATYTSPGMVVLKRAAQTKDVTATVIWQDNDDQYGERPDHVNLALYADKLDGGGPQHTGRVERCDAVHGWAFTFEDVPALYAGKNILYSVVASGNLPNYTVTYDGLDVYMTHAGYRPGGVTTDFTATIVWKDGHNAKHSRPYGATLTLYANGAVYRTYTLVESDVSGTNYTWSHTFADLPTKLEGQAVEYTIGVSHMPNYTARVEGNTVTLTHVMDLPILVRWDDDRNNDGKRPGSLTLDLFADAAGTGISITLTGAANADTWRGAFLQVPVWSEAQTDREIRYTWKVPNVENVLLGLDGYAADYNGYLSATVAGELVYPVDIRKDRELADCPFTVTWQDDTDRDGLRPDSLTVRLYANGADTGEVMTLTGGNEDPGWSGVFRDMPVWKDGRRIRYSLVPADLAGYTAATSEDDPMAVTMTHDPAREEIICTVVWDDATCAGGLQRFPISAELLIDGSITRLVGNLDGGNGYRESWDARYLYHDHGVPYDYTFAIRSEVPADYEATVDGWTITVRRVRFLLDGRVLDHAGAPIPGAAVTLFDSANASLGSVTTGTDGYYSFSVTPGVYTVRGSVVSGGYLSASICVSISNDDLTQDVTLEQKVDPPVYTYAVSGQVTDSNGNLAPGAVVTVRRADDSVVGTATADDSGRYALGGLPNGLYAIQASYAYNGMEYLSESAYFTVSNADTVKDIVVPVPKPEAERCTVTGRVVDKDGNPVPGVTVRCYEEGKIPAMMVEVVTDENGVYTFYDLPTDVYKLVFSNQSDQVIAEDKGFTIRQEDLPTKTLEDVTASDGPIHDPPQEEPGYGTLSGVAQDQDGQVVPGAQLVVRDGETGEQVVVQETGANGDYSVDLPNGDYDVSLWKPFENATQTPVEVDDPVAAQPDGPVTADSFTLEGVALDEAGAPRVGVTVYLYVEDSQGFTRLLETTTDAGGVYIFAHIDAGQYVVKIVQGIGANGGSIDLPVTVSPEPQLPDGADLTVTTDSYTVSGVVEKEGAPVRGAQVTLLDEQGGEAGRLTTGEDGAYRFSGLPRGSYTVDVSYPDSELLSSGQVTIEGGGFVAFTGCAVSGAVKDSAGNALAGVTVTFSNGDLVYTATTERNGVYHLAVPEGTYTVKARCQGKTAEKTAAVQGQSTQVDLTIALTDGGNDPGGSGSGGSHGGGSIGGGSGSGGSHGGGSGSGGGSAAEGRWVTAYVTGYPDGTFGGAGRITRMETVAIIARVSPDFQVGKLYPFAFDDVSPDVWYAANLGYCVQAGLVQGRGNGIFDPNAPITRAEFAAIVARFLGLPNMVVGEDRYTDLAGNWAAGYICQLTARGIVEGKGNGRFDPNAYISRYEAVTMLNRALDRGPDKAVLDALVTSHSVVPFPDLPVGHWAYYQVLEAAFDHYHK